ncbi:MAG: hypothetical protein J1F36_04020 [Clostridiales bacterium]|nr:hypothetical protein [Clostridiales bacterium]
MKRIIYDYENPHIVGRAKSSFPLVKVIVGIIIVSLVIALIYILFFHDSAKYRYEAKEYYAVVMGKYDSESAALTAAEEIKARGGGGYVIAEQPFGVVAAVYQSEADALTVAERYGYEVKSTGKYTITASREKVKLCALPEQLFDSIYSASLSLDKGEISEAAASYALNRAEETINEYKKELVALNSSADKLLSAVEKMYDKLTLSILKESSYSVSSRLKYCLSEVTFIYKSFLISIS